MNEKRKGKEIKMLTALIQYIIEIIMTSVDLIRRKLYIRILREGDSSGATLTSWMLHREQRRDIVRDRGREDIVREGGRTL